MNWLKVLKLRFARWMKFRFLNTAKWYMYSFSGKASTWCRFHRSSTRFEMWRSSVRFEQCSSGLNPKCLKIPWCFVSSEKWVLHGVQIFHALGINSHSRHLKRSHTAVAITKPMTHEGFLVCRGDSQTAFSSIQLSNEFCSILGNSGQRVIKHFILRAAPASCWIRWWEGGVGLSRSSPFHYLSQSLRLKWHDHDRMATAKTQHYFSF
jgi:hypothetical protein